MPNPIKITFAFKDTEDTSWTESYYDILSTTTTGALDNARQLWKKRVQLLGANVKSPWLKVTLVGAYRVFQVEENPSPNFDVTSGNYYYNADFKQQEGDFSWATLLCKKSCTDRATGNLYLSGCPDIDQMISTMQITDTTWNSVFNAFARTLASGPYGLWAQNNDDLTNAKKVITDYGTIGLTGWTVVAHGLNSGDKVRISGVKPGVGNTGKAPQGVYQVKVVTADGFQLVGWNDAGFHWGGGGTIRKQVKVSLGITNVEQVKFTSHKRGSSLFSHRGRVRTRA